MQSPGSAAWAAQVPATPPPKPRIRVTTDGEIKTTDSYVNFLAAVGATTPNIHSGSTYGFLPLTRQRTLLEWVYRGSWIVGVAVDAIADDMTKLGLDWGGTLPPDDGEALEAALTRHQIWTALNELIKWGRLYGGALAVILISGQDPATPLRFDTINKTQFKGLLALDRWRVEPLLNDLVTDPGPDLGMPKFYRMAGDIPLIEGRNVHYSRVMRYEGIHLPWWQAVTEMLWGMSIVERLWSRLTAFDSTTEGVAQLVYKAYLRIVRLKGLRELGAANPDAQRGLQRRIEVMQRFQTNEGITLLDAEDEFQAQSYSFSGLDTVLLQMGQQLAGALQIPLVRLFGQSPVGLNATGDSDWRNYYDGVNQTQETRLRRPLTTILKVLSRSEGIRLPATFNFTFRPLWQLQPKEKADLAEVVTRTVLSAQELGLFSDQRILEELRQSSRETGVWATITDKEVAEADDQPPEMGEGMPGLPGMGELAGKPGGPPGLGEGKGAGPPGLPGAGQRQEPGQHQGSRPGSGAPLAAVSGSPGGGRGELPVPLPHPPRPHLGRGPAAA